MSARKLDKATARELAVRASVDPRTIERIARGENVRGLPGRRAREALREAGILPSATPQQPPAAR
jgi:hypothetical protein